ncbi:MAG: hypothetical protein FJ398_16595 [Verrucomicrobia bacterium]|nr:hypothetical protein [Verrucomicrobiota bacterium]
MKARSTLRCLRSLGKPSLVGLLLFLWVRTTVLAASPALHAETHPDAQSPKHQCLVTLLAHGKLLFSEPELIRVQRVEAIWVQSAHFSSVLLPAVPHRLSSSRAPPAAVSSRPSVG